MRSREDVVTITVPLEGQTIVPVAICGQYWIGEGDFPEWIDDGQVIKVVPIPPDPVKALRGSACEERLVERLLDSRQEGRWLE